MDLVVVGFEGRHRAAQVLTDLRQRGIHLFDLEQAISVSWEDRRNFIVQQSVNISRPDSALWTRVWGALINATLFQPFTERLDTAASTLMKRPFLRNGSDVLDRDWLEGIGVSSDFIRDIGALVGPGDSAIMSSAKDFDVLTALDYLRSCGGSMVHAHLSSEQIKKVEAVLTLEE